MRCGARPLCSARPAASVVKPAAAARKASSLDTSGAVSRPSVQVAARRPPVPRRLVGCTRRSRPRHCCSVAALRREHRARSPLATPVTAAASLTDAASFGAAMHVRRVYARIYEQHHIEVASRPTTLACIGSGAYVLHILVTHGLRWLWALLAGGHVPRLLAPPRQILALRPALPRPAAVGGRRLGRPTRLPRALPRSSRVSTTLASRSTTGRGDKEKRSRGPIYS